MKQKQVKNVLEENILLDIVNSIKTTGKVNHLIKKYSISKQLLSYYTSKLKSNNTIKKIGYGTWEVLKEVKTSSKASSKKELEIRGHGFNWKIKIPKEMKGYNSLEKLDSKGIKYKLVGILKNIPSINLNNHKTWLCNDCIIIYDSSSYFDFRPVGTRKKAIYEILETLKILELELKINIKPYNISSKREHYAKIRDNLAIQINQEGLKLRIIDKDECWMEIDDSNNLDETEFYKTKSFSGLTNSTGYQNYYNEHKDLNWEVSPKFILKSINAVTQNQTMFAENIKTHMEVLNNINKAIYELRSEIKNLNNGTKMD